MDKILAQLSFTQERILLLLGDFNTSGNFDFYSLKEIAQFLGISEKSAALAGLELYGKELLCRSTTGNGFVSYRMCKKTAVKFRKSPLSVRLPMSKMERSAKLVAQGEFPIEKITEGS